MPRTLRIGDTGPAVLAAKRSVFKCLGVLGRHPKPTSMFGPFFAVDVKRFQKTQGLPQTGVIGERTWMALDDQGCIDAYSDYLLRKDAAKYPALVFPFPVGVNVALCQRLHPTAGIDANWALDWCCRGGTPVLAPERAKIKKLSGHDPSLGEIVMPDGSRPGIFGWSIHYETPSGYRYFSTHYGEREPLMVGQMVEAGQKIGEVGWWPGNPGRSHLHLGVTSPYGESDAKRRITAVDNAERVRAR